MREKVFKVETALIENQGGEFRAIPVITRNGIPEYEINDFVFSKTTSKVSTARTYAFSLIKFLNYLDELGYEYTQCTGFMLEQYVRSMICGDMQDLKIVKPSKSLCYSTINGDITAIKEFYKHMKIIADSNINIDVRSAKKHKKQSFLYGQIQDRNYEQIVIDGVEKIGSSKEYLKWYTYEEKEAILTNLQSLRDKVIFLMSLEGMRIDEILSLDLNSIDDIEQTVKPMRSKRRKDGSINIRMVSLPQTTFNLMYNYVNTERADAEYQSGVYSEKLFINIKKGENQGKPMKYRTILNSLKRAGCRAGLDGDKIRTHSGRSTKVDELLTHQSLYPEDNLTDNTIKDMLGWSSIDAITPYKNSNNSVVLKSAASKVRRRMENEPEYIKHEEKVKEMIEVSRTVNEKKMKVNLARARA